MGIVTGPRSGSVTGNNRLVLGQRRKQEEQQAVEEAQEVGSRVRFGSSPASIPQPLPRMSGALEMDDTLGSTPIVQEPTLPGRNLPVIGPVLRGLDATGNFLEKNPVTGTALSIGRDIVSTGGAGTINTAYGLGRSVLGRIAPTLAHGNTIGQKIGGELATEAIAGVPVGIGQSLASGKQFNEAIPEGILGGAIGGGISGLGVGVGRGLKQLADNVVNDVTQNAITQASQLPNNTLPMNRTVLGKKADEPVNAVQRYGVNSRPTVDGSDLYWEMDSDIMDVNGRIPKDAPPYIYNLWYKNVPEEGTNIDLIPPEILRKGTATKHVLSAADEFKKMGHDTFSVHDMSPEAQGFMKRLIEKGYLEDAGQHRYGEGVNALNQPLFKFSKSFDEIYNPSVKKTVQANVEPDTKVRSNFVNQQTNGNFSKDFYQAQSKRDLTYEPQSNKETMDRVNQRFSSESVEDIRASFQRPEAELSAEHTATGYRLMQELDKAGRIKDAVNVAEKLAADLTRAGQTAQAASVLSRLSPEGQLLQLTRQASRNGKTVSPQDYSKFKQLAEVRQNAIGSGGRTAQFMDILDRMKKGETVSTDELESSVRRLLDDAKKHTKEESKPRVRDKVLSYLEKEAEAAFKELQSKRNLGFAQKIGKPDIVLVSKIMAHEIAKKAVDIADFTEMLVKQAGEAFRPHAKEIYDRANKLLKGADKRVGVDKVKLLDKFLTEGKFNEKDENSLREIAKQLDTLQGKQGLQADMEMQKILNKYQKSSPWGMVQTLRYIAMLLNESTQTVNLISGPMMMTYRNMVDIFITPFDAMFSKKGNRSTTFKQGPGMFDDVFTPMVEWFKGLPTGFKAGWHGVDPEGIHSQHDLRGRQFKDKFTSWNLGVLERSLGAVSKAGDYATFNAQRNMELRKLAYLDAINSGVKGKDAIRAHMDKFLADPPQTALEQAARQGKKTTFQNDGIAQKIANSKISRYGLTTVVPFIKTPMNIGITGIENTPAGLIKGMFELYRLHKGADDISKREILQTLAFSTAGGTMGLGGLGYILGKMEIITGDYESSDKDVQALADAEGEGKFKFNTTAFGRMFEAMLDGKGLEEMKRVSKYQKGDKQIDYNKLQPIAFPVAAGATFSQDNDIVKAGKSSLNSLFGMSALQGIHQTFDTPDNLSGSEKSLRVAQNVGINYTKSFSPSLLAREAQRQDPVQRKTTFGEGFKDISTYYQSRIPGKSQELPPRVTNLGDTKESIFPYLNPLRSEETKFNEAAKIINGVIKQTGNEKLAPQPFDKTIRGTKKGEKTPSSVSLDPQRYAQVQQEVGQEISKRITSLPQSKRNEKEIEKIYSEVREKHRNKLKKEFGFKIQ